MDLEVSLPRSQKLDKCPYPKPDESNRSLPILFLDDLPSMPKSSKRLLPSSPPPPEHVCVSFLPHACHMFRPSHSPYYDYCLLPLSSESFVLLSFVGSVEITRYKIIIFPVILYGCETWSLILRGKTQNVVPDKGKL
jgi:hypothetical protein